MNHQKITKGIDYVMKAFAIIAACVFIVMLILLTGCANLTEKAVILDNSVQGFKVTTGADTTSGTPFPNISAGWGSNLLITMPTDKKGTLEYEKESGSLFGQIFGIEVTDKVKVRITAGDSKITVTSSTNAGKEVITQVGNGVVSVNVKSGMVLSISPPQSNPSPVPTSDPSNPSD
ncbi:MAG: hypothetical protein JXR78_01740 [Victivallales bacterium]|nr:hypothetical protein [Victivallales bacterium]